MDDRVANLLPVLHIALEASAFLQVSSEDTRRYALACLDVTDVNAKRQQKFAAFNHWSRRAHFGECTYPSR